MRAPVALFVTYLAVITGGILFYGQVGLAERSDDPAAGAVVGLFGSALTDRRGAAACALLAPETRAALERERKKRCALGIVEVRHELAPAGPVASVERAELSAMVSTAEGDVLFLDRFPGGWLIAAAGCEPQPRERFDCEVEG